MAYGNDDQARAAAQQVIGVIQSHHQNIQELQHAVNTFPQRMQANQDYEEGRELCRQRGIDPDQLEQRMVERGIARHTDAIRLNLVPEEMNMVKRIMMRSGDSNLMKSMLADGGDDPSMPYQVLERIRRGE